jgi:hypothetical protein
MCAEKPIVIHDEDFGLEGMIQFDGDEPKLSDGTFKGLKLEQRHLIAFNDFGTVLLLRKD